MEKLRLVGLIGSSNRPSRSFALVEEVARRAGRAYDLHTQIYDLTDFAPSLGNARRAGDLGDAAQAALRDVLATDVLVVGTPTYKGSYTGLFKHLIDLIDPQALAGKPVVLTATGGGERHALVVEHQLRPLFGFFSAQTLGTAIYAADRDFTNYRLTAPGIVARVDQIVNELAIQLGQRPVHAALAAE